jgi:hypothetical protein
MNTLSLAGCLTFAVILIAFLAKEPNKSEMEFNKDEEE